MKHLFIGGPLDGERIDTGGAPEWRHEETRITQEPMRTAFDPVKYEEKRHTYQRHWLGPTPVYAHEDLIGSPLDALIRRYPNNTPTLR